MDIQKIIDQYRNGVIQIATPYSTGTGFYLKEHDLIVTNEHVVRDNKKVVINGKSMEKQMASVLYVDPKYDLAFLTPPSIHQMSSLGLSKKEKFQEGDTVLAVGHPFGLKFTATQGILSSLEHIQENITYLQHDAALNPGNSGGPLIDLNGEIIGVNTFIIRNGNNIGFSLPVKTLHTAILDFTAGEGVSGVRCNSCSNVVFENTVDAGYCNICGSDIKMISDLETYEAVGINKSIESLLSDLDYDINLSRKGPSNWQIIHGSADIQVSYYEKTGLIVGDAFLCKLPKKDIKPIYTFLLQQNFNLEGLTFSVKDQAIILSLLIYDQYFKVNTAKELFEQLFETADKYDVLLVEEYGAEWKSNNKKS